MTSLPQISATLGPCMRTKKNINTPCIAQLHNKMHLNNLVSKPTFSPLVLVEHEKNSIGDLRKQCKQEKWKAWCSDDGSCGVVPEFLPPPSYKEIIIEFYKALNTKDTETLEQLLSPNECSYEDYVLYGRVEGKEGIMNFFENAMDAMGSNIHIVVDEIKENNHQTATVFWHLEWEETKIPFTNGCRFFTFEEVEGRICISKITGMEELPVKPGELMLKLLKAIRMLFDKYPLPTKAILESHASDGMHFDLFGRKR
ncbi:PREDICTED: uncharacterized protein LOC109327825 [Lupinus angustifolius]|nr:PREDICTED: uncharacterized protein LOC109327824 [Lupinus angustifolius]XP_019416538.1 PREDICTED: uncharacterized protein LOC109327825 [Lupinus angustifolius]